MGSISPVKILVVVVVALLVLGPDRLPEMTRKAGKAWGDFRRLRAGLESQVRDVIGDVPGLGGPLPTSPGAWLKSTVSSAVTGAITPDVSTSGAPAATVTPAATTVAEPGGAGAAGATTSVGMTGTASTGLEAGAAGATQGAGEPDWSSDWPEPAGIGAVQPDPVSGLAPDPWAQARAKMAVPRHDPSAPGAPAAAWFSETAASPFATDDPGFN